MTEDDHFLVRAFKPVFMRKGVGVQGEIEEEAERCEDDLRVERGAGCYQLMS